MYSIYYYIFFTILLHKNVIVVNYVNEKRMNLLAKKRRRNYKKNFIRKYFCTLLKIQLMKIQFKFFGNFFSDKILIISSIVKYHYFR